MITPHRLTRLVAGCLAASASALMSGPAEAAKQMSYSDAFTRCKQELSMSAVPGSSSSAAGYAAGGACMKKYGYRLKKKN
jgi:mevalonate pyrophosphate decarboxylase